jgi:hypothetical protein
MLSNSVLNLEQHWILNFWRCYDVFLSGSGLDTLDDAFANQRNGTNLARFIVYEVQAWMGDCLLVTCCSKYAKPIAYTPPLKVYRLYYVCGRKWAIVAVPCVMCTALAACGIGLLLTTINGNLLHPESITPFRVWAVACFSLTFGENLYCLVAIAFFIWRTQHDIRQVTTSPLTAVMWIFVESAGMWLLFVALTFFIYLGNTAVSLAFAYITNPMLGISFCLMITRLNLHFQRRSRASFAYVAKNLDTNTTGQSKEIAFTPTGLYVPRPPNPPFIPPLNSSKQTASSFSIALPV